MNTEEVIDILQGIKDGTACLMKEMPKRGEIAIDMAINALSEQRWVPVKERNPIEYDNPIEFMATLEDPSGERYVEFIEWDGYEWDDFYTDDNERGVWGYDKVVAWTKKPEPFKGDLNE